MAHAKNQKVLEMNEPLDVWVEKHEVLKLLRENLQANLDVMTELSEEEKVILMRLNLIMIRQSMSDLGLEK